MANIACSAGFETKIMTSADAGTIAMIESFESASTARTQT